ncbi:MAG TPA: glycosyltransferase [Iamia sp.]|nr:glycosyltransferase [Iamia sp.]
MDEPRPAGGQPSGPAARPARRQPGGPATRPLHLGALFSPVPGHLHPFAVLGRELARRGHTLTALNIPDVGPACEAQGMPFRAVGSDVVPVGSWERLWTPIAEATGLGAIRATAAAHRQVTRAMCAGIPAVHEELGFDGLLVDEIQFQGRTIADHLGIPFATLAPFIPTVRTPGSDAPPPFLPFDRAGANPAKRLLNRAGYGVLEVLARPVMQETNEFARRWGLAPVRSVSDTVSSLLHMTQAPASLAFADPCADPPAPGERGIHHLGSLLDDERPSVPFPWARLDGCPLVYVSLGTLQNQRPEIYATILDALDRLPVQGVVSLGRWRGGEAPPVRSDRHVVVDFAPQQEVIARAAAVVTHAGMNTTIEALAAGVPLVAVPITNDQPAVAKRVELEGAGVRVPLSRLRADRLEAALRTVLDDPALRAGARRLQGEIRAAGGVTRAADLVEQAFGGAAAKVPDDGAAPV